MTIDAKREQGRLVLRLNGRLDTGTAPQLEKELAGSLEGVTELQLDLTELEYVSSAGLRVLLAASKRMKRQGSMTVCGVSEEVMEVFTITGFTEILTIL